MPKFCDNTSTGILFWNDKDELLLIERKKHNPGFACPAGHNDGDTPEDTARKESSEEVGLAIEETQKALEMRLDNPCLGRGGTYHDWSLFEAVKWHGEIIPGDEEVKSYRWVSREGLRELAVRLERFMEEGGYSFDDLNALVRATNHDERWIRDPGLEPPWYILLKELDIL